MFTSVIWCRWRIRGGPRGAMLPLATWASAQNALKVAIFRFKIENFSGEEQCPLPRPQLVFLCINHNVVSNKLVLPPRAICIHTTASFPTSNGFWRLDPRAFGARPRPHPICKSWIRHCMMNPHLIMSNVRYHYKPFTDSESYRIIPWLKLVNLFPKV